MITITDIIITNNYHVLLHTKVNLKVVRSDLNSIRESITMNHVLANKYNIDVLLKTKEHD